MASAYISNTLGTVNPVAELAAWAHERDAVMVVDACQAVPNRPVDVQELGCDFLAFTGHKMLAPTGIGVVWGRQELLQRMSPYELGGSMIRKVTAERTTWADLPYKYEAGTPPIAEAFGLGKAIDYLSSLGLAAIERHERELTDYAFARLAELPYVRIFGPPAERRGGIVSFEVDGVHPHDVAQILDSEERRGPGRSSLHPADHGSLRRHRDDPGELLPLYRSRRDRPAGRGPRPRPQTPVADE